MITESLERMWWQRKKSWQAYFLLPLSLVFHVVSVLRSFILRKQQTPFSVPLIVVGNLSVGGNGKTPLLISLVRKLQKEGYYPGIVSRGYGAKLKGVTLAVKSDSLAREVGDEPLLIAQKTDCPVVVSANRNDAVNFLLRNFSCDLILSDDGLQHYSMHRDIELVLINYDYGLGNRCLLPAGPLREPPSRLKEVDFVISECDLFPAQRGYSIVIEKIYQLGDGTLFSLEQLKTMDLTAITAIAKPERFFRLLERQGLTFKRRTFPDHHFFSQTDLEVQQGLVIMSEKDAVKCKNFKNNIIVVAIDFVLEPSFWQDFIFKVNQLKRSN